MSTQETYKPSDAMGFWLYQWNDHVGWRGSDGLSGKWMLSFNTMEELDEAFEIVADAVRDNKLGDAVAMKSSTSRVNPGQPHRHFFCIYVRDFNEERRTLNTLKAIRALGYNQALKFKRDKETFAGVYGDFSFYMEVEEGSTDVTVREEPYAVAEHSKS